MCCFGLCVLLPGGHCLGGLQVFVRSRFLMHELCGSTGERIWIRSHRAYIPDSSGGGRPKVWWGGDDPKWQVVTELNQVCPIL